MKKVIYVIACSLWLGLPPVFGQPQGVPGGAPGFRRLPPNASAAAAALPTFDLNFPGGGPTDLVKAIVAASGKPLNVIINKLDEDTEMPPLKMTGVNVVQLFLALELMSEKTVRVARGGLIDMYSTMNISYGFQTTGDPTENSIWYFHVIRAPSPTPVSPTKVCRFFSLAPYLEHGFTVDDITTAIQTGWKMAKDPAPPELNYHKETKLLMAFGDPDALKTIESVLQTLPSSNATRTELDSLREAVKDLQAKVKALEPPAH